jgi:hypothetical protein
MPELIPIVLPNYRVGGVNYSGVNSNGTPGLLPLGHAAFILDRGDGTGTYYEWGLYGASPYTITNNPGSGNLRALNLLNLQYDSSGNITQSSLRSVLDSAFGSMYSGDVGFAIVSPFNITTNQRDQISGYIDGFTDGVNRGTTSYSIMSNDCMQFVYNAANAGSVTISSTQNNSGPAFPQVAADGIYQTAPTSYQYFGPNSWNTNSIQPLSSIWTDALSDAGVGFAAH